MEKRALIGCLSVGLKIKGETPLVKICDSEESVRYQVNSCFVSEEEAVRVLYDQAVKLRKY
tara:strand:- start:215 stop:397 length:183 start_codon:yes stop_codon:yes gene_type:complete